MARRKAWNSYAIGVIGAIRCLKQPVIIYKKTVVEGGMLPKNPKSGEDFCCRTSVALEGAERCSAATPKNQLSAEMSLRAERGNLPICADFQRKRQRGKENQCNIGTPPFLLSPFYFFPASLLDSAKICVANPQQPKSVSR
jgi:hypothetical protein